MEGDDERVVSFFQRVFGNEYFHSRVFQRFQIVTYDFLLVLYLDAEFLPWKIEIQFAAVVIIVKGRACFVQLGGNKYFSHSNTY